MCFSHLAGENRHYYWPYMSMGHSFQILMDYIFPLASGEFFHTYVLINFQPNTIGVFSKYLYGSHSVQLSPLWYSVLWTLVTLFSLDFQLHFLTSGIPRVLHLDYPALHGSLETQADNLGHSQCSVDSFSLLSWITFLHCLIASVLKSIVSYILSILFIFVSGGRINLVLVVLYWSEVDLSIIWI